MQQQGYHVAFIRPEHNVHAEGLREVALTLEHGLRRVGVPVTSADNVLSPTAVNVVVGGHLLSRADFEQLPADTILYNFEQICDQSLTSSAYLAALGERPTWDYSRKNIARLRELYPGGDYLHVPLGHVPELGCIEPAAEQDIDVLFYGSENDRRLQVLDELEDADVDVRAFFGVYGAERDALIARSKLVLNLHYYPTNIFEVVRVSYLLANAKAVVAECGATTEIETDLRDAVEAVAYDDLVPTCLALLADEDRRHALERRGRERMRARDEAHILASALGGVLRR